MYVVYINLLYFCRFFCLLTIKIFFPKKILHTDIFIVSFHWKQFYDNVKIISKNILKIQKNCTF